MNRSALFGIFAICGPIAGCAVGPNYAGPPAVAEAAVHQPRFLRDGGATLTAAPPPAKWWEQVGDPQLSALIEQALAASPSLASAEAKLRSARAQVLLRRSKYLPSGGGQAAYLRARIPTGALGTSTGSSSLPNPLAIDLYSANLDASWEIDLFGATRRSVEAARASADSQEAAFEDAQVALAANVGQAYAQLRAAQDHVALTQRTIALRANSTALTQQRLAAGTAAQVDLDRQRGDLEQARAALPGEQASVEEELDELAILTGRAPGSLDATLVPPGEEFVSQPLPPTTVPVGTPAEWLRRRPDIREAERTLAARTATVGQNVAAYFPTVSILGLFGNSASYPSGLTTGVPISLIAPQLSWSFLDIPRTRANVRSAEANRDQALADYENTVLQALLDANRSLERFGRDEQALRDYQAATESANNAARLTRERFAAGTASLIDSLDTERERRSAEDQLVSAKSDLMVAYVTLQKSLGLGWGAPPPQPLAAQSTDPRPH